MCDVWHDLPCMVKMIYCADLSTPAGVIGDRHETRANPKHMFTAQSKSTLNNLDVFLENHSN